MGIRGAGGGRPILRFPAYALATPQTNGAPLSRSNDIPVRLFDDSTSEKVQGGFILPDNFKASGDVIVRAYVQPVTPADANAGYSLSYKNLADEGNAGAPWTTPSVTATEHAVDDTADRIFLHEQSWSSLSWTAGSLLLFLFARDVTVTDNLTGDLRLFYLEFELPV